MDVLAMQMERASLESGSSFSSLIDTQNPTMLGSQKRARQYIVLSDTTSWSLAAAANVPGATSTIQISNKGILDLKNSYIDFKITMAADSALISPVSLWEVLSWQIGSKMQVNLPYPQPLQEVMFYRQEREEISKQNVQCDQIFKNIVDVAGLNSMGQINTRFQIPFSQLCHQFDAMEHIFIGLGQPLQIQLRLRQANECTSQPGAGATSYTVTNGQLVLSYIETDSASMDKIVRSRVQFNMPRHQAIPVPLGPVMNMTFPVNNKDYVKYLVLTTQTKSLHNADAAVANTLGVQTKISGLIRPLPPIRRLQIIYGEQQIQLIAGKGFDEFAQVSLSDLPFSFQFKESQKLFSPYILDLTRFGLRSDAFGSQVPTQSMIVTVELSDNAVDGKLPSPYTGTYLGANNVNVQFFGYLVYENQCSIQNGLYQFD